MIDPQPEDVGRRVRYQRYEGQSPDWGYITSFNKYNIFVRYDGAPPTSSGQATSPLDLEFAD